MDTPWPLRGYYWTPFQWYISLLYCTVCQAHSLVDSALRTRMADPSSFLVPFVSCFIHFLLGAILLILFRVHHAWTFTNRLSDVLPAHIVWRSQLVCVLRFFSICHSNSLLHHGSLPLSSFLLPFLLLVPSLHQHTIIVVLFWWLTCDQRRVGEVYYTDYTIGLNLMWWDCEATLHWETSWNFTPKTVDVWKALVSRLF